jgi:excinuclease ABC subunit C
MTDWTGRFETRLDVESPLDEQALRTVPARRGVFLLTDEDDRPVVLLTAADMRSRLRKRLAEPLDDRPSRRADLRQITRWIHLRTCSSHFETDWQYLELARRLFPKRYRKLVAWKPPWLVQLDPADAYPHFARTRDLAYLLGAGTKADLRAWGPFPTAREAEAFIEALQDGFDLCRSVSCLRKSPVGPRCAYAEMGRCLSPADGSIAMEDYRTHLRRAADCASGDRSRFDDLRNRMQQASAELAFEHAAAWKQRLDRLAVLDESRYEQTAPLEAFRWLLVQPGQGRRELQAFTAGAGFIADLGPVSLPTDVSVLAALLRRARALCDDPPEPDEAAGLRMGLVTRRLFSEAPRRGLVRRLDETLGPSSLAEAIQRQADDLRISEPILERSDPTD